MIKWFELIMMIGAVTGSLLIASNSDFSKFGFILFLISSIAGIFVSYKFGVKSMMYTQIYFTGVNAFGVVRWFL